MDFAPLYLLRRLWYRIQDFFHHWYVDGSRAIGNRFMLTITAADQSFAVRITLHHFFEPLYKDYSIVGRVVGIIFRSGRLLIGSVVYLFISLIFIIIYAVWLAIPVGILWIMIVGKA